MRRAESFPPTGGRAADLAALVLFPLLREEELLVRLGKEVGGVPENIIKYLNGVKINKNIHIFICIYIFK